MVVDFFRFLHEASSGIAESMGCNLCFGLASNRSNNCGQHSQLLEGLIGWMNHEMDSNQESKADSSSLCTNSDCLFVCRSAPFFFVADLLLDHVVGGLCMLARDTEDHRWSMNRVIMIDRKLSEYKHSASRSQVPFQVVKSTLT
jgi:hypothetical protein